MRPIGTKKAFTLVEIMIVVLILGILGAISLPAFSNAALEARLSILRDDLRILRTQVAVFRSQHRGVAAGYPGCDITAQPTEASLIEYMTQLSDAYGQTAPLGTAGFHYGPYLREMPPNPINRKTAVQVIGSAQPFPAAADDSHGWIYKPATLEFRADCLGNDDSGRPYFEY